MLNWTGLMTMMMQTRYSSDVPIRELHGMGTTPLPKSLLVDWVYSCAHRPQHWVEATGQFYNLGYFFPEKEPLHLLRRRLGGLQNRSGRCRLEINKSSLVPEIEPRFLGRPAFSLVDKG